MAATIIIALDFKNKEEALAFVDLFDNSSITGAGQADTDAEVNASDAARIGAGQADSIYFKIGMELFTVPVRKS